MRGPGPVRRRAARIGAYEESSPDEDTGAGTEARPYWGDNCRPVQLWFGAMRIAFPWNPRPASVPVCTRRGDRVERALCQAHSRGPAHSRGQAHGGRSDLGAGEASKPKASLSLAII